MGRETVKLILSENRRQSPSPIHVPLPKDALATTPDFPPLKTLRWENTKAISIRQSNTGPPVYQSDTIAIPSVMVIKGIVGFKTGWSGEKPWKSHFLIVLPSNVSTRMKIKRISYVHMRNGSFILN